MVKSILCIFLAGFILLRPILPVLEYAFNYDYISTRLCENRDKPELNCNGKCYLKKKLVKAQKEASNRPASQKTIDFSELLSFSIENFHAFGIQFQTKSTTSITYGEKASHYTFQFSNIPFHPPVSIV